MVIMATQQGNYDIKVKKRAQNVETFIPMHETFAPMHAEKLCITLKKPSAFNKNIPKHVNEFASTCQMSHKIGREIEVHSPTKQRTRRLFQRRTRANTLCFAQKMTNRPPKQGKLLTICHATAKASAKAPNQNPPTKAMEFAKKTTKGANWVKDLTN